MLYSNVLLPCLQIAFIGTLLIFLFAWLIRKIICVIQPWTKSYQDGHKEEKTELHKNAEYSIKQDAWKKQIQQLYLEKAARYKENIQIPRAREKRERKEKEFYKHFGPSWSGEGEILGGEDGLSDDTGDGDISANESTRAARRRKLPESEPSKTIKVAEPKTKSKTKRVIVLPDEPDQSDPESVLVIMRTPISTIVRRRFGFHHSLQNVLDFMTKSGFNQVHYQLCTSFPRYVLSQDPEVPLSDLGFGNRVILNIEDKAYDDS